MNVLLLEDEADLSAVAVEQLEACGCKVSTAFSLAEARSILQSDSADFDLLIADHHVPDGSGAHFAISTKISRDIKVVVVSGCLNVADVEELELHRISYYDKPLRYAEIVKALSQQSPD